MEKNKVAMMLVVLLSSASIQAANVSSPISLVFPENGQFTLDVSNNNPNMFVVPGDKIIAINSSAGVITDKSNTRDGAIIIATTIEKDFTFFLETEKGQAFSVNAKPKSGVGKSYRLQPKMPIHRDEARVWEQSQPYEQMLISLNKSLSQGVIPSGYTSIPVLAEKIKTPAGLKAKALAVWVGGEIKVTRYEVVNESTKGIPLNEADFWSAGVRAVMFAYQSEELASSGSIDVYVTTTVGVN